MKISSVILTRNEEKNINRCLDSVKKWCDEIIVIDDNSKDETVNIARSRGVKVFERKLDNDFASQRNFGLQKAKGEWALFLDADEVVSPSLARDIVRRVKQTDCDGFFIPRREVFANKVLHCADKPACDWSLGPIKLLRLAKKGGGKWHGKVHEKWKIKGKISKLKKPLYHYSFSDITTALRKINFYTSIQAKQWLKEKKTVVWYQIIIYPLGKLLKNFIWHQGFLDGTSGFIFCLLMSLHSFLARAKLWHLQNNQGR